MNKKIVIGILSSLLFVGLFVYALRFYDENLRGIGPALKPAPEDITKIIPPSASSTSPSTNTTGIPLKLPPGFSISIFAKNIPGARVMRLDQLGNMWVSQPGEGQIQLLEVNDGVVARQSIVFRNLQKPHGLAFDPDNPSVLYFEEENKISKVTVYGDRVPQRVASLPEGGNHTYYSMGFGPDRRLYIAFGSTCNVCHEVDGRRAKIFSMNKDASDFKEFARGLRNAPFFTWHPKTGKLWVTEMGRDLLGDDIPPDEINIVEEGKNYGWPICYGKNIHDTDFDKNTYIRNPCMEPFETPAFIDIPAHSAPLGLSFLTGSGWPDEYQDDLLVSYHGSWNRSEPTGYKVVRHKFAPDGSYEGVEDFITGWLRPDGALGRPVDILIGEPGVLYISDDKAGVIYKVTRS